MISSSIKKKIKIVLADFPYDKVYLFGSFARGDNRADSDYDLLVVLKEIMPPREKLHLSTILRKKFAKILLDADVIIKDSSDILYLKDKPGNVVHNALLEGVML